MHETGSGRQPKKRIAVEEEESGSDHGVVGSGPAERTESTHPPLLFPICEVRGANRPNRESVCRGRMGTEGRMAPEIPRACSRLLGWNEDGQGRGEDEEQ